MKRYFITGLGSILPIFITVMVLKFIINFLTTPFLGLSQSFIALFSKKLPFLEIFETPELATLYSQLLILIFLFLFIALVGFLAEWLLVHTVFKAFDKAMHKIPLINSIYKPVQDILHTLFSDERPPLTSPVQIPFSKSGANVLAFVTNETVALPLEDEFSAVYMPSPPNPMLGFLVLIPKDKIAKTSLSAERSIRFIASCGIITPTLKDV